MCGTTSKSKKGNKHHWTLTQKPGTWIGNIVLGVHKHFDSLKVFELKDYSSEITKRIYVHELLSAVTVLIENKVLVTGYYLNPFRVFKITRFVMFSVLRGYLKFVKSKFPNLPHIAMGDLNPTSVEPDILKDFENGLKSDGVHILNQFLTSINWIIV
jgi:hypothetical protein